MNEKGWLFTIWRGMTLEKNSPFSNFTWGLKESRLTGSRFWIFSWFSSSINVYYNEGNKEDIPLKKTVEKRSERMREWNEVNQFNAPKN